MESLLLDKIDQPSDLKKLNAQQVEKLCAEIRHFMLENISKTGGHLASNLGTVELTVALHRVLETPKDKIVFDVGHQCYTHKLLTGRRKQFDHLRQLDGISGFPNPHESVHDAFIAGHGNTALSLAIGMAWAKKIKHEPGLVVAVIGDGAFTGGMVYEGMNNIGGLDNLLVILNDNKMSISKNVGALARYLTHLRTTTAYYDAKDNVRSFLDGVPLIGTPMKKSLIGAKTLVRRAMYHSTMFEDMGFEYIGPVDGHNVEELERTLRSIYQRPGPHFLHIVTKKGKGYQPAEMNPGNYHGVSAFDPDGMPDPEVAPKESFSTVFGKLLVQGAVNTGGTEMIAAYTATSRIEGFANSFGDSGSAATSVLVGQNIGAKKSERVRESFRASLMLMIGMGVASSLILYVSAGAAVGFMLGHTGGIDYENAVAYIHLIAVFYTLCFMGNTFAGYFNGIGRVDIPLIGATSHITLRVVLSWLLVGRMGLPAVALATGLGWGLVNVLWALVKRCSRPLQ